MFSRLNSICPNTSKNIFIWNFHKFGSAMLRYYGGLVGLKSFTPIPEIRQLNIVKQCYRDLSIDVIKYPVSTTMRNISLAKDYLLNSDYILEMSKTKFDKNDMSVQARLCRGLAGKVFASVYSLYQRKISRQNLFDFGGAVFDLINIFKQHSDILERIQNRFKYILVDEFQDLNYALFILIKMLAGNVKNIFVVDDDDQSIYGFRGAFPDIFRQFRYYFPDCKVFKLEQNSRSAPVILEFSHNLISHNSEREKKQL
jgi:DNA helicase-2/ATP-dependent DNA helicase PcrA